MDPIPSSPPPLEGDLEIDLRAIFGTLWRRRWVIGGCVLLITVAALLVVFQLTPRYTASAQVLIDPREQKVADVEAVLSGLSSDSSTIESQIQVIKSRSLAGRVVEELFDKKSDLLAAGVLGSGPRRNVAQELHVAFSWTGRPG